MSKDKDEEADEKTTDNKVGQHHDTQTKSSLPACSRLDFSNDVLFRKSSLSLPRGKTAHLNLLHHVTTHPVSARRPVIQHCTTESKHSDSWPSVTWLLELEILG